MSDKEMQSFGNVIKWNKARETKNVFSGIQGYDRITLPDCDRYQKIKRGM